MSTPLKQYTIQGGIFWTESSTGKTFFCSKGEVQKAARQFGWKKDEYRNEFSFFCHRLMLSPAKMGEIVSVTLDIKDAKHQIEVIKVDETAKLTDPVQKKAEDYAWSWWRADNHFIFEEDYFALLEKPILTRWFAYNINLRHECRDLLDREKVQIQSISRTEIGYIPKAAAVLQKKLEIDDDSTEIFIFAVNLAENAVDYMVEFINMFCETEDESNMFLFFMSMELRRIRRSFMEHYDFMLCPDRLTTFARWESARKEIENPKDLKDFLPTKIDLGCSAEKRKKNATEFLETICEENPLYPYVEAALDAWKAK